MLCRFMYLLPSVKSEMRTLKRNHGTIFEGVSGNLRKIRQTGSSDTCFNPSTGIRDVGE